MVEKVVGEGLRGWMEGRGSTAEEGVEGPVHQTPF